MNIAVEYLYSLRAIPYDKAKQMLASRFMRLATTSISTSEPTSTVVSNFITARNQARADLIKNSQLNAMCLYTEREIYGYAQAIDKKINKHCPKGNASYEAIFNKYSKDEILAMSVEVPNEFKKNGEK